MKYISLPAFLISFVVGLFCVFMWGPDKPSVVVFPTLENYTKTQYKDKADQCFKFVPIKTQCPLNQSDIKTIPIQQ